MLITTLRYLSFSTGSFGSNQFNGICLQFICDDTGENYHVFFNADIKRERNVGIHKAGSVLPRGRFKVTRRQAFYMFWVSTGLKLPPRLSAFNDYMGKLKAFTFSAEITSGTRLDARSLRPVSSHRNLSNKFQTTLKQSTNKVQTKTPNNDLVEIPTTNAFTDNLATCENKHVTSKQVNTNTRNPNTLTDETKRVQNQTREEGLAEYDNAGG